MHLVVKQKHENNRERRKLGVGEERKSNEENMKDVGGKNKEGAKVDPF